MDCKEAKELLNALADGELSEKEKEEILSHIAVCEDCKNEYDEIKAIKKEFENLSVSIDGRLADSVMEKITAETHPKKKSSFIFRHIGTVAALLVVAGMFYLTKDNTAESLEADDVSATITQTETAAAKSEHKFAPSINNSPLHDDADSVTEEVLDQAPSETMPEESLKVDMPMAEAPAGDSLKADMPMAEESAAESESTSTNNFRLFNSIGFNTAIIFVESDMKTLTPLFNSIVSIGSNSINLNQSHTDVMDVLCSNSITITSTDIPEITTDTVVFVE